MQPTIDDNPQVLPTGADGPRFTWEGIEAVLPDREPRVHFKQCVRVVPIGGPPRAYRVLAANLSRQGMLLKMPTPLDTGTRVALSLEAGGRVLPFAQGEVVWRELSEPKAGDRHSGFGVRFTGFLHPRAHELVDYLVANLGTGKPLVAPLPKSPWPRRLAWLGAGLVAVVVGAVITSAALRMVRESHAAVPEETVMAIASDEVAVPEAVAAPAVAPAPVVEAAPEPVIAAAPGPAPAPVAEEKPAYAGPVIVPPLPPEPEPVRRQVKPRAPKPEPTPTEVKGIAIPSGAVKAITSSVDGSQLTITLGLAANATVLRAFTLAKPDRIALDVKGALPKKSYVINGSGELVRARIGRISGGTRVVLDLSRSPGKPTVSGNAITLPLK